MKAADEQLKQAREIMRVNEMLRSRVIYKFVDDLSIPPLTPKQMALVVAVMHTGGISIKSLADELGVTASSASIMVDRLVDAGILTREQNPADRREVVIRISSEYQRIVEPIERHVLQYLVGLLHSLGGEKAAMWYAVNQRIREILELEGARPRNVSRS